MTITCWCLIIPSMKRKYPSIFLFSHILLPYLQILQLVISLTFLNIRKVQKFASQMMSKEIQTWTAINRYIRRYVAYSALYYLLGFSHHLNLRTEYIHIKFVWLLLLCCLDLRNICHFLKMKNCKKIVISLVYWGFKFVWSLLWCMTSPFWRCWRKKGFAIDFACLGRFQCQIFDLENK